jgi:hypothetical protein
METLKVGATGPVSKAVAIWPVKGDPSTGCGKSEVKGTAVKVPVSRQRGSRLSTRSWLCPRWERRDNDFTKDPIQKRNMCEHLQEKGEKI